MDVYGFRRSPNIEDRRTTDMWRELSARAWDENPTYGSWYLDRYDPQMAAPSPMAAPHSYLGAQAGRYDLEAAGQPQNFLMQWLRNYRQPTSSYLGRSDVTGY